MEQIRDTFVEWLRDAHAAEKQALTMLGSQAGRIENYPALKARIEQHIQETESQVAALEGLLERYSTGSSMIKDATGRMMAFAQGMSGMTASDEVVKGGLFSYSFEHMEIASYQILIATARRLGDTEAVSVLERIFDQEVDMANWLQDNMDSVVNEYLTRLEQNVEAKR
ncbi:ferritin-like domain-containing protein [uncultured Paracoccus sp.]|uniref:ferritin-like domain-containing protein n=1 Tax=uncultured Paracoccus sp. TaxID=189685 RepID=UPI0025FD0ECC|nr:ferritin-like domain-containing protein [uncultured Paracoccus sp.]